MNTMPTVHALITDLDNTLYDWVTFFSEASLALAETAAWKLNIPADTVLDEMKVIHQRYGDSEHPFALLEIKTVVEKFGTDRALAKAELQEAFDAFNLVRDRSLVLYAGVRAGLEAVHASGCPVIGHTEANVLNASFRLRKLGILSLFTRLYAIEHAGLEHPEPSKSDPARHGTEAVRLLSNAQRKPNRDVLRRICGNEGLEPENVVYVGDSIARDVGMAKAAGCWAAWAKYGTRFQKESWNRLVRISHWSRIDIDRAQQAQRDFGATVPDCVLEESFDELLTHFVFAPRVPSDIG